METTRWGLRCLRESMDRPQHSHCITDTLGRPMQYNDQRHHSSTQTSSSHIMRQAQQCREHARNARPRQQQIQSRRHWTQPLDALHKAAPMHDPHPPILDLHPLPVLRGRMSCGRLQRHAGDRHARVGKELGGKKLAENTGSTRRQFSRTAS